MSTLKVTNIQATGETASRAVSGVAAAWVNFNGTGTVAIRDNQNVSSISDNGTGNYTVNLSNAMINADYAVAAFTDQIAYHSVGAYTRTSTQYQFVRLAWDATVADVAQAGLAIHGDLA